MAFAFSVGTVFDYMFSLCDGLKTVRKFSYEQVGEFVSVLEREITSKAQPMCPWYKYVYMDIGEDSLEQFFMNNRDRYLDFGAEFIFIGEFDENIATEIEKKYDDEVVIEALRKARHAVRCLSEE